MAALPRAGRARRKVEVAESSIHLRETERQRIRVCDKCGNTDPTWCCSCEITPSGKLTRIRIAPPASDAEQLKEQIKVLQLGNTRLKLQTERRKAVIGKGKRASCRVGEFLLRTDEKLDDALFKLKKQIESVGYAIEGMAEPCIICRRYPNLGPEGDGSSWIVPRCGHPVCSTCVRDVLDPRFFLCPKCRQPLYDYSYIGATSMETLKTSMDATLCQIRRVHDDIKGTSFPWV